MRLLAVLFALAGTACAGATVWLLIKTARFYWSAEYAPHSGLMPGYRAGPVEADGSGIFLPTLLLGLMAAFLLKFAYNLWRKP